MILLQKYLHCPAPETISHLESAGSNFSRNILKSHWKLCSISTTITNCQQWSKINGVQEIDHPKENSSADSSPRFTLRHSGEYISPGPGQIGFSKKAMKISSASFSANNDITNCQQRETDKWKPKIIPFTRAFSLCLFRQIQTFLHRIQYLTWTWTYWNLQGSSENIIGSYFMLVPPLTTIKNKRLISGGQK